MVNNKILYNIQLCILPSWSPCFLCGTPIKMAKAKQALDVKHVPVSPTPQCGWVGTGSPQYSCQGAYHSYMHACVLSMVHVWSVHLQYQGMHAILT